MKQIKEISNMTEELEAMYCLNNKKRILELLKSLSNEFVNQDNRKQIYQERIKALNWIINIGDIYLFKRCLNLDYRFESTFVDLEEFKIFPQVLKYTKTWSKYIPVFFKKNLGEAAYKQILENAVSKLFEYENYKEIIKLQDWYGMTISKNLLQKK